MRTIKTITIASIAIILAGCAVDDGKRLNVEAFPIHDDGVLLASTSMVGSVTATKTTLTPSDCIEQLGVGVSVHMAKEDTNYLFDKAGEPCVAANIMFDGRSKAAQRAASLGVDINFVDPFAERLLPKEPDITDDIPLMLSNQALMMPDQVSGLHAPQSLSDFVESPDKMPADVASVADNLRDGSPEAINSRLSNTIKNWRSDENRERLLKETEQILADVRTVKRVATLEQMRIQQDQILELTALLRETERKAQLRKEQRESLQKAISKKTVLLETERTVTGLENNKLREHVEQLQARIKDFDRYNRKLKHNYDTRQAELQKKIANLSADLKESESRSKNTRQAAVLQAAQQIAESERLAYAAQIAQRQQLEMEAERLQMEAVRLASKATKLPNRIPDNVGPEGLDKVYASIVSGRIVDGDIERLASVVINGKATAHSLGEANVALEVKDMSLRDVFALIVANVENQAGSWRISWQLHPKNAHIAEEEWTVAVEATVSDIISYVGQKVFAAHKVKLSFKMFGKNRVVVITDDES